MFIELLFGQPRSRVIPEDKPKLFKLVIKVRSLSDFSNWIHLL